MFEGKNKKIIIIGVIVLAVGLLVAGNFYFYKFLKTRQEQKAEEKIIREEEEIKELSTEEKKELGIDDDTIATFKEIESELGPMKVITIKPSGQPLDSDGDGLSDKREEELGTNPLKRDTDGDGVEDGDEIKIGINPLKPDNPFK